jgi:hypothetical protein
MAERIRLFANGFEWEGWDERNCSRCVKAPGEDERSSCELYDAITDAMVNGGTFPPEIVARFEWREEHRAVLGWPGPELETEPAPPKPAATVMAEAGAPMLPGFGGGEG